MKPQSVRKFRYSTVTVLYSYQSCRCFYCHKFLRYKTFNPADETSWHGYTLDHFFPKTFGYKLRGNAVLACRACNAKKDNRWPSAREVQRICDLYTRMGETFTAQMPAFLYQNGILGSENNANACNNTSRQIGVQRI